jgi:hypothetical protein
MSMSMGMQGYEDPHLERVDQDKESPSSQLQSSHGLARLGDRPGTVKID